MPPAAYCKLPAAYYKLHADNYYLLSRIRFKIQITKMQTKIKVDLEMLTIFYNLHIKIYKLITLFYHELKYIYYNILYI